MPALRLLQFNLRHHRSAEDIIGSTVDSVESLRIDCRVIRRRERRPE
jgi:hypothetical protein